jgi:PAS domain S-box-containing protein
MALSVSPDVKNSKEQFRLLVDAVQDYAIYLLDPDGRIASWNRGAECIKGYRAEEVIGRSFEMFFRDEDRRHGKPRELLERARREGRVGGKGWRLRKGGIPFLAEVTMSPIWNEDGRLEGYAKVTRDITQKKALDEMRSRQAHWSEMERQFRALSDAAPVLIWMADPDGGCTYFNKTWLDFTGRTPEMERGDGWSKGLHPDDRVRALDIFHQGIRAQAAFTMDFRLRRADGEYRWMLGSGSPRTDSEGALMGFIGSALDIHERKELEVELQRSRDEARKSEERYLQSQKMEAVGRLAGGIAHDFNNLLTAINGYSEIALSLAEKEGSGLRESLVEIREAGKRAASLTHQLLAFSRKQILTPKVVDLNDVVGRMETMLRRLIGENIHLVFHAGLELPNIRADISQVEQVILNLSVNARDAMPSGGSLTMRTSLVELDEIQAAARQDASPGKYVALTITDTGTGMDQALMARIFEPFFTTKEAGKGTGLGLAMVYGVVKQSGGSVEVRSELGKGTAFQILFPASEVRETRPTEDRSPEAPALDGCGDRVIIVEDEESVRNLVAKILADHGYDCLSVENAEQALAISDSPGSPVKLLLTDVMLKGIGGPALAEKMRARNPSLKVLYMSGYSETTVSSPQEFPAEGMEFLTKPFTVQSLLERMRHVLQTENF